MVNKKILWLALFFSITWTSALFSQANKNKPLTGLAVKSLTGDFSRTYKSKAELDSIKGKFYYTSPNQIFFEITYPVHQIMRIVDKVTQIYYPESRKGFILESTNPVIIPLIPGLLSAIRPDYGLSILGFKLKDQQMKGDTLLTFWAHSKLPEKIGRFTVAQVNNRLKYTYYEAPDSVSYTKTFFSDYIPTNENIFFPGKINTKIYMKSTLAFEKIRLSNLKVNKGVPQEISHFKIPDEATIVKRKW